MHAYVHHTYVCMYVVDTQRPPPPWEKRWKCLAVDHRGCPPGGRATGDCFQRARGARHVAVDAFDRASGGRGRVCDSRQGPRIGSPGASETGREGTAHAAGCLLPAQQASPPLDEERAGLLPHSAVTRTRPHRGIQPRLLSSRVSPRRYACAGAELRPPRQTEYVPASARSRLRNWDRLLRSPLLQTHPASQPAKALEDDRRLDGWARARRLLPDETCQAPRQSARLRPGSCCPRLRTDGHGDSAPGWMRHPSTIRLGRSGCFGLAGCRAGAARGGGGRDGAVATPAGRRRGQSGDGAPALARQPVVGAY